MTSSYWQQLDRLPTTNGPHRIYLTLFLIPDLTTFSSYPFFLPSPSFFLLFFFSSLSVVHIILITWFRLLNIFQAPLLLSQIVIFWLTDGGLLMGLPMVRLYTQTCNICPFMISTNLLLTYSLLLFIWSFAPLKWL